jgi:hypothetical protein
VAQGSRTAILMFYVQFANTNITPMLGRMHTGLKEINTKLCRRESVAAVARQPQGVRAVIAALPPRAQLCMIVHWASRMTINLPAC